jgi:hypothetical protein
LSGKASVQDREEVEENKEKEMNGQERKLRTWDRKKRIVP